MELEQQLRAIFQQQLNSLEHDRRCLSIEWHFLRRPLQEVVIEPLIKEFLRSASKLELENKKLVAKFNRASFQNDQARDYQILELHRQGLSNLEIGRIVGMSRQGVAKALRRINGNSVTEDQKSPLG